jgi:hypothetical protein
LAAQRLDPRLLLHRFATPLAFGILKHDVRMLGQNLDPHWSPTVFPPRLKVPHWS